MAEVYNDILLDSDGDIKLNEYGDAILTNSIVQNINTHLRWFMGEWVFDESRGMSWFEDVFVKNPDTDLVARMVRSEIGEIDGVTSVESVDIDVDNQSRSAVIRWTAKADKEKLESEVELWAKYTE